MSLKIALISGRDSIAKLFTGESINRLKSFGDLVLPDYSGAPDAGQAHAMIKDADIVVTSWGCPAFCDIPLASSNMKLLVHAAGTVKTLVSDEIWQKSTRVVSCSLPLGRGVAETALGLTISSLKNFWGVSRNIAAGGWKTENDMIVEVYGINIGVVGAGMAGSHYIKLIKNFNVNVYVYDPFLSDERAIELGVVKTDLHNLLKNCDVVSLHAPSIESTKHMINEKTLSMMKKDAVLINTARGSLIDENALYAHMTNGGLKYACLDVTDPEPPLPDNPLRKLDNVIFTPHLAGLVNNGLFSIGKFAADEIERFIEGKPLHGEITQDKLAVMA